jgi:hypothetical protein
MLPKQKLLSVNKLIVYCGKFAHSKNCGARKMAIVLDGIYLKLIACATGCNTPE